MAIDQRSHRSRWSLTGSLAEFGFSPIICVSESAAQLAARRCGRIITVNGRLEAVHGRWWPYLGNRLQVFYDTYFKTTSGDRCELYYHAPLSSPNYLTLDYVRSGLQTSLSTFYAATLVLDQIARLRQANGIVCNVTNDRISDRLMLRWGWNKHCLEWSGRHFVKRFYGEYPDIQPVWRERLTLGAPSLRGLTSRYDAADPNHYANEELTCIEQSSNSV